MSYTVADLNSYDPKSLDDFVWDTDRNWHALWCGDLLLEGESVSADELRIGDVVIHSNGIRIDCIGRVVKIDGWGHNQYWDHLTFEFGLDVESPKYFYPYGVYTHVNSGITVIRSVNGEPI